MGKTEALIGAKRCVIFGGGKIEDYKAVKAQLRTDDFILCADSGYLHCEKLGAAPDLLLGDFDSLSRVPGGIPVIKHPVEKNYTDSALAARYAAERGYTSLLLTGMLGGRFDHALGNLQLLAWCVNHGIKAKITDGITEVFAVKDGEITIPARENAYFSVLSLTTESLDVTILNGKYPLDSYLLRHDDARAVSNEFCGGDARVLVKRGLVAIVTTPKDSNS